MSVVIKKKVYSYLSKRIIHRTVFLFYYLQLKIGKYLKKKNSTKLGKVNLFVNSNVIFSFFFFLHPTTTVNTDIFIIYKLHFTFINNVKTAVPFTLKSVLGGRLTEVDYRVTVKDNFRFLQYRRKCIKNRLQGALKVNSTDFR